MTSVFISYRRSDVPHAAGRLHEHLARRYGKGVIFLDHENIPLGSDFAKVIFKSIETCDCLVVVIGPGWLDARQGPTQARRLEDPNDFVRAEIEHALRLRKRVIPVLLQGAGMPRAAQLVPSLAPLADLNALELRDGRFADDCKLLIDAIDEGVGEQPRWRRLLQIYRDVAAWSTQHPAWTLSGLTSTGLALAFSMHQLMGPVGPQPLLLPPGHVSAEEVREQLTAQLQSLQQRAKKAVPADDLGAEIGLVKDWLKDPEAVAKRRNRQFDEMEVWKRNLPPEATVAGPAGAGRPTVLPQTSDPKVAAQIEYLKGLQAYETLALHTAQNNFNAAVQYDPQHLRSWAASLQLYLDLGQPAQAVQRYAQMKAPDPGTPAPAGDDSLTRAEIDNVLAIASRQLNQPEQADRFFAGALARLDTPAQGETAQAQQHRLQLRSTVASNFGKFLVQTGQTQRGLELLQNNLHQQIAAVGEHHVDVAQTHLALAQALQKAGPAPAVAALPHFEAGVHLLQSAWPGGHLRTGQALIDKAQWHAAAAAHAVGQDDAAQARLHFSQAQAGYENARKVLADIKLPDTHITVVTVDNNRADLYRMQGKYALALELYDSVVARLMTDHARDNLTVGRVMFNKGLVYLEQEMLDLALPSLQEGLRASEKASRDVRNPQTQHMARHVVDCLRKLKRHEDAARMEQTYALAKLPAATTH